MKEWENGSYFILEERLEIFEGISHFNSLGQVRQTSSVLISLKCWRIAFNQRCPLPAVLLFLGWLKNEYFVNILLESGVCFESFKSLEDSHAAIYSYMKILDILSNSLASCWCLYCIFINFRWMKVHYFSPPSELCTLTLYLRECIMEV